MRGFASSHPRSVRLRPSLVRWIAIVSASGAALATTVAGSPAAFGAASSSAGPSSSSSTSTSTSTGPSTTLIEHVVVMLKNQHDNLPATAATVGARVNATDADQAPLIALAQQNGGTNVRQLHVANAFAVTISQAGAAVLAADPAVATVVPDEKVADPTQQPTSAPSSGPKAFSLQRSPTPTAPVASTTCPSDPSKPLLEPEALQLTHDAFADPSTPSAQKIATGKGVTVAFLADGLDINNPDFIRPDGSHVFTDYQDFSGEGPNAPTPGGEAFGDASSIAAQGTQTYDLSTFVNAAHPLPAGCNIKVLGMAPGASLVGLKVFPAGGFAFNSTILQALDWAVTHDHADVINESFGSNQFPDTNNDPTAVFNEQLVKAGIVVVASTGDAAFQNTIGSPASAPDVIGVGATTQLRLYSQVTAYGFQLSSGKYRSNTVSALSSSGFTQPGRTIDLVAPGDLGWALCTPNPDLYFDCLDNNGNPASLEEFGGTSESAPLTAGAAALVIQAYRDSHGGASPSAQLVKTILTSTADDLGLPAQEQGAGLLDALRAVRAARAAGRPSGDTNDVLASPGQLDLTTSNRDASGDVAVTNLSSHTQAVHASVRSTGRVLNQTNKTVSIDAANSPSFVDQVGIPRAYEETKFEVPRGTANLHASIAWAGPAAVVRLVLLDPNGVFSAYSLPQGAGDFGEVAVPSPVSGNWTALIWTAASAAGFTGDVRFSATSTANSSDGRVSPSTLVLRPGQTQSVHVSLAAPNAGDDAAALVLSPSGREGRAEASTSDNSDSVAPIGTTTVVPIVVRKLVTLHGSRGTFSGIFGGGNGRPGIPAPGETYAFDVPDNAPNLFVGVVTTGNPNQAVYAFLVDPNGEPVSEQTNQRVDSSGNLTALTPGVQLDQVNPQAGRWMLVFAVLGPVAGTSTTTPFTGVISLSPATVKAERLPNSTSTKLDAGKPVTATVSFTNTGVTDANVFVDGRLADRTDTSLVVKNNPYTFATDILPPFPAFSVPTETDSLTVSSTSSAPTLFEISPFPADQLVNLSFEGDPDLEAGPAGTNPSVTDSDPIVAPQTWLALPTGIGPFTDAGSPSVTNTFTATAHTRPFDANLTSTSGDPLLADVDASAPAATPVHVAVGEHGSIKVTITPTGNSGDVVQGILYLDTWDAVTGSTNEIAAIPYSYTIS